MQEMLYPTSYLKSKHLDKACALITDGRFSGGTSGLSIGHISPEAAAGGALAIVRDGDLIEIDIPARRLAIVGIAGEPKTPEEVAAVLAARRTQWRPKPRKYRHGVLRLYAEHAVSPMKGAYMDLDA